MCTIIIRLEMAMSDFDPYSIRLRDQQRADQAIPYRYEDIPYACRMQIFHILDRVIGDGPGQMTTVRGGYGGGMPESPLDVWKRIHDEIAFHEGELVLGSGSNQTWKDRLRSHFVHSGRDVVYVPSSV
jgi:hypothetical protein